MKKILQSFFIGFLLLVSINHSIAQVNIVPASPLQLCPDNNYANLGPILITESANNDFLPGESNVTYSVTMPSGFKLEPFTGLVSFSDSFTAGTFTIYPDSVFITYSLSPLSGTAPDTIIISGLSVRTNTASIVASPILRSSGTATHNGNAVIDALSHGSLSSGVSLTGISGVPTAVTCNGDTDGEIAVSVATGNAPYLYSLDFGSSYPYSATPITGLSSGGYIVTVQDNLGCVANSSPIIINNPSVISALSVTKTDMSCNGLNDGSVTALGIGGTGTITYSINGSGTFVNGSTTGGQGPGLKNIVFTDANSCTSSPANVTVNQPSVIVPGASTKTDITCNGLSNGVLTANATGGSGTIRYSINGIAGPYNTIVGNATNGLSLATYDIYLEDANGCQIDAPNITINQPSQITEVSATKLDIDCNANNNGEITASASGGTLPINFSITGFSGPFSFASGNTAASLPPGAYSIYYRDANLCIVQGSSFNIIEPSPLTELNVTKTDISCNSLNDGSITASAIGGTGSIVFSTNGPGGPYSTVNGGTATGLTPGLKNVYFRDANLCQLNGINQTIINPTAININAPTLNQPTFTGAANGSIIFGTVSGGTPPYTYSIMPTANYQTNSTFNNLPAGNYTIRARDANLCVSTFGNVVLVDPGNITGGAISFFGSRTDTTICTVNASPIEIFSNSIEAPRDSLRWQISTDGVVWNNIMVNGADTNYIINSPHANLRYFRRLTYKGGDLAFSNIVQRKINNGSAITLTIPDPIICVEDGNQIFSASPAPGSNTSGIFSLVSGSGITDNTNGTANFNPSTSGTGPFVVNYQYTNEFGCITSGNGNITVNQNTSVTFIDQTAFLTTDPSFTLTGGMPAINGTYSGPAVFGNQFFPSLFTTADTFPLTYTQIDGNGCSGTANLIVTVSGAAAGSIIGTKPEYCSDEAPSIITGVPPNPGGTAINFISIPGLLTQINSTTAEINPDYPPGDYDIIFEYQLGASVQNVQRTIRINTAPLAQLVTNGSNVFCLNDPNRVLNGSGTTTGAVWEFIGNGIISDDNAGTAVFDPSNAGSIASPHTILFAFEDDNGCNDTASVSLIVHPLPVLSFVIYDSLVMDTADVNFCKNEENIALIGNISGGSFFSNSSIAIIPTATPGLSYFDPLNTPAGNNRDINYTYADLNTCRDTVTQFVNINALPIPGFTFDYKSNPIGDFNSNVNITNFFCTQDPAVDLIAIRPTLGSGFFKLDTIDNGLGGIDTTVYSSPDTVVFRSGLPSGKLYQVLYVYTDNIGCTDSISRPVFIQAEPEMQVRFENYNLTPTIDNTNNIVYDICNNGDFIRFVGLDQSISGSDKTVDFYQSSFVDATDNSTIGININGADTSFIFNPNNTAITGSHALQFDYTANTGCQDIFTFAINILDTPEINLVIDTNDFSFITPFPQLCNSVPSLTFRPDSFYSGSGFMWFTKQSPLSPDLLSDTIQSITFGDSILIGYPDSISLNQSRDYFANYQFTENVTSQTCTSELRKRFRINPLPKGNFVSNDLNLEYCFYDDNDTLRLNPNPLISSVIMDTAYFKGFGFSNIDSFTSILNPRLLQPNYSDTGSIYNFWYIYSDTLKCTDSIFGNYVVHPIPQIDFTVKDQGVEKYQFCQSSNIPIIIEEIQTTSPAFLSGNFNRSFDKVTIPLSQANFQPTSLTDGEDTLRVYFTSLEGNCRDTVSKAVYLYPDPNSDFIVDNFCIDTLISIRDLSLTDTSGGLLDSIVSWRWEINGALVASIPDFSFDFAPLQQGTHNIELTIENSIGCIDNTDSSYFFGEPPVAKFSIDDYCEDSLITFTSTSDNIGSLQGNYKWRISSFPFNPATSDTLTNNGVFSRSFLNPGAYAIQLDLATSEGCNDNIIKRLDVRPIIQITDQLTYQSNLDNDSIEWRPGSLNQSGDYTWVQGIPSGTNINSSPSGTVQNVWITNDSAGRYIKDESSYIEGPCYNFLGTQRPMIQFDYFADMDANTGGVLQYSLDKGATWRNIGVENSGKEWYNKSSISGNPGNQTLGQRGWSKKNTGWLEARHNLDVLRDKQDVRLRIAFGADDNSGQLNEGLAIGNFEIRERNKLVLVEHFTNATDEQARQGDFEHNNLLDGNNNRFDALDIQYHTGFPNADPINLDNSLEQGARSLFYGVSTVPRTVFEGNIVNAVTGTWTSNTNILGNGKHKEISDRILENAKFSIDLDVTKTMTDLSGTVTFTSLENLIPGREYTAFVSVIEKEIPNNFPAPVLANVVFRNVFKKFLPQASGTNIKTLNNIGDTKTVNFNWTYSNVYDSDEIYVVAFIQDNVTREIYQVATDDSTTVWVPNAIDNAYASIEALDFTLYPNPSRGRAIIEFPTETKDEELLSIYDQMGKMILQTKILPGTKNLLINLEDYVSGLYILQIEHPKYGTKQSRLVITK